MNDLLFYTRAIHFAATISVVGVVFFIALVGRPAVQSAPGDNPLAAVLYRHLTLAAWISLVFCVLSGAAWLLFTAQGMAGEPLDAVVSSGVLGTVLTDTDFGRAWILRGGIICLLAAAFPWFLSAERHPPIWIDGSFVVLAGTLAGTLVWAGHGTGGNGAEAFIHTPADFLHLVAAAAWVGMLLPLALLLGARKDRASIAIARTATLRFSALGVASVATLLITGSINTWYLAGSIPALVGTFYGRLLLAKIALFAVMVAIAAFNRLQLTPRLSPETGPPEAEQAIRWLRRNVAVEIAAGAIIILVVAVLGVNPPGLHEQPDWPFSIRLDFSAFADPSLRTDMALRLAFVAIGTASLAGGILVKKIRWLAIVTAIVLAGVGAPGLQPLFIEAYPTSYYASPVPFTARSVVAGARLFATHCAICHGAGGRGDGVAAAAMTMQPADLTADHVHAHSAGDLYWWISHGIGSAMPPFQNVMSDRDRWNTVNFIHANADATRLRRPPGGMSAAFPVPEFSASCADGSTITIDRHVDRAVHIVVTEAPTSEQLGRLTLRDRELGVTLVVAGRNTTPNADLPVCVTQDRNVIAAFTLYAGSGFEPTATVELLVDREGRLRSLWRPDHIADLKDIETLTHHAAELKRPPRFTRPAGQHPHLH